MECTRCKQDKPMTEFYRNKQYPSGYTPHCKECHRMAVKRYKQTDKGKASEERYNSARKKAYEPVKKANAKKRREERQRREQDRVARVEAWYAEQKERSEYLRNSPTLECTNCGNTLSRDKFYMYASGLPRSECIDCCRKYYRDKYHQDPTKKAARAAVSRALEKGRIVKPEKCSMCNSASLLEGHHEDYSKPLDVIWVCKSCHTKIHWKKKKSTPS